MDKFTKVTLISKTVPVIQEWIDRDAGPAFLSWINAHRCYSKELSIVDNPPTYLPSSEQEAADKLIKNILKPGHFSVIESFSMTFEISGFVHGAVMQALRHRVAVSYSVTSGRYTGERILNLVDSFNALPMQAQHDANSRKTTKENEDWFGLLEATFYSRPAGLYTNRAGNKFTISEAQRLNSLMADFESACLYHHQVTDLNYSEETARDRLPQSLRQSYICTFNLRSLIAFLDRRSLADSMLEIQFLAKLLFNELKKLTPEISGWYEDKRLGKNKLSP